VIEEPGTDPAPLSALQFLGIDQRNPSGTAAIGRTQSSNVWLHSYLDAVTTIALHKGGRPCMGQYTSTCAMISRSASRASSPVMRSCTPVDVFSSTVGAAPVPRTEALLAAVSASAGIIFPGSDQIWCPVGLTQFPLKIPTPPDEQHVGIEVMPPSDQCHGGTGLQCFLDDFPFLRFRSAAARTAATAQDIGHRRRAISVHQFLRGQLIGARLLGRRIFIRTF
jgi:hypothetical protein